jgi:hypothetical protein
MEGSGSGRPRPINYPKCHPNQEFTGIIVESVYDPRHFKQCCGSGFIRIQSGQCSVVDPDSLNMDPDFNPDPAFQVNPDLNTGF